MTFGIENHIEIIFTYEYCIYKNEIKSIIK